MVSAGVRFLLSIITCCWVPPPRRTCGHGAALERARAERALDDKENLPLPLPPFRRSVSQFPAVKQSCPLFTLPPEIRLQIYEYVLSDPGVVHLFLRRRRVGHIRCTAPHRDPERSCMAGQVKVSTYHKHYELQSSSANTALLRTCRAIYQEAVDVLYSANTFDASHPQTFVCFARTIPPQRLASISSLQVAWLSWWSPLDYESERGFSDGAPMWWKPLWEIAATQMPGLKHVQLHLQKIEEYAWREAEELLLRDLLPLRGLSSFNLERTGYPEPIILDTGEVRPLFSALGSKIKDIVCAPRTP